MREAPSKAKAFGEKADRHWAQILHVMQYLESADWPAGYGLEGEVEIQVTANGLPAFKVGHTVYMVDPGVPEGSGRIIEAAPGRIRRLCRGGVMAEASVVQPDLN